jgi:hypothetical protein
MAAAKKHINVDLSPENWCNIVDLHLGILVTPAQKYEYHPDPFPDREYRTWEEAEPHHLDIIGRIAPVLIETGFFRETSYKQLSIFLELCSPWDRRTAPVLQPHKGDLWARRRIHFEEFGHMSAEEFKDFQIGVAAEALVAVCAKYGLNSEPAYSLRNKYPVPVIPMSSVTYEPEEQLLEPAPGQLEVPLTNKELVFPSHDSYNWTVYFPYTADKLASIGPDERSVHAPVGELVDDHVRIANAMLCAPTTTLIIRGSYDYLDSDLSFLKHFRHLRRVSLFTGSFDNLDGLRQLSPDLIKLELDLRFAGEKPSLAPLDHFRSLQSLTLIGHCEDLSQFKNLKTLRALRISEVNLKNLSWLTSFPKLQSLRLDFCNIQDISALAKFMRLQYLSLAGAPKLTNVDVITNLRNLEYLELAALPKLEKVPDLGQLVKLRRVDLENLKLISDLSGVSRAPKLEYLLLQTMK